MLISSESGERKIIERRTVKTTVDGPGPLSGICDRRNAFDSI